MIAPGRLIAERRLVNAFVPGALPSLSPLPASVEKVEQRLRRMWSAGRSIALISACLGLEAHEIRDRCRGIPRPSIRIGLFDGGLR